jgi:hypothetical protein
VNDYHFTWHSLLSILSVENEPDFYVLSSESESKISLAP